MSKQSLDKESHSEATIPPTEGVFITAEFMLAKVSPSKHALGQQVDLLKNGRIKGPLRRFGGCLFFEDLFFELDRGFGERVAGV